MFNQEQRIPCPVCNTAIPFKFEEFIRGAKFTCHSCQSSVGLMPESIPLVKESVEKLEKLKQGTAKSA